MVAKVSSYEECWQKRMEENKKRMEALNLSKLSQSLRNASSSKPSQTFVDRVATPRRTSKGRSLSNRVYASDEARQEAMEKADIFQSGLEPEFPSFTKSMLQSHVSGGFWLGLPADFCRKNLPKRDDIFTLIDQDGEEYPTIYLPRKTGLSGGWKGFAVAHKLADGDALVFQLFGPTAFKIYIIRANVLKRATLFEPNTPGYWRQSFQ